MIRSTSHLLSQLAQERDALKQLAKKARADGTADEVHNLRVLTRRLRAPLWLVHACRNSKGLRKVRAELRHLGRALGERRKWDVAIADARSYGAGTKKLRWRCREAGIQLHRSLKRKPIRDLIADLEKTSIELGRLSPDELSAPLHKLELTLSHDLKHPPTTKPARHRLRIRVKKIRYLLEALGHPSACLEKLQDHLGREHDLDVLQSLSGKTRTIAADERRERSRAEKLIQPALRSAVRELKRLQKELRYSHG